MLEKLKSCIRYDKVTHFNNYNFCFYSVNMDCLPYYLIVKINEYGGIFIVN